MDNYVVYNYDKECQDYVSIIAPPNRNARTKQIHHLWDAHGKRRPARAVVKRERQIDIQPAWLEQSRDHIRILAAPGGIDGAKTGVFQNIVEGIVQGWR